MRRLAHSICDCALPVEPGSMQSSDFGDAESQLALAAVALAVARELGREAAHEYFAKLLLDRRRASK